MKSWTDRKMVAWQELLVCTPCCKERLKGRKSLYKYLEQARRQPLPTLDLFGGVGAFSRGLAEGSGCLEVTHAIEISPSAAKTFMYAAHSPGIFFTDERIGGTPRILWSTTNAQTSCFVMQSSLKRAINLRFRSNYSMEKSLSQMLPSGE